MALTLCKQVHSTYMYQKCFHMHLSLSAQHQHSPMSAHKTCYLVTTHTYCQDKRVLLMVCGASYIYSDTSCEMDSAASTKENTYQLLPHLVDVFIDQVNLHAHCKIINVLVKFAIISIIFYYVLPLQSKTGHFLSMCLRPSIIALTSCCVVQ